MKYLILWYVIRILNLLLDFDFVKKKKKKNQSTKLVLIVAFILTLMTN